MFGYVFPYKPELKMREYEVFKAYYCGLCKELGKKSTLTRFGLNYDFTFLSLLICSIQYEENVTNRESCFANVIKKKNILKTNNILSYCAELNVILYYLKLIDDWKDNHSIKSLLLSIIYYFPFLKIKNKHKFKYLRIKKYLKDLYTLEKEKCCIMDKCAHTFANIMKHIFQPPYLKDNNTKKALGWLGYNLGKWIYMIDAYDDIDEDIKKNNYNPYVCQYGKNLKSDKEIVQKINLILNYTLDTVAKSFELIDFKNNKPLLSNIIYMGLPQKMDSIINKGARNHEQSL